MLKTFISNVGNYLPKIIPDMVMYKKKLFLTFELLKQMFTKELKKYKYG